MYVYQEGGPCLLGLPCSALLNLPTYLHFNLISTPTWYNTPTPHCALAEGP